jgi:polysaccharide export outer membrane protein
MEVDTETVEKPLLCRNRIGEAMKRLFSFIWLVACVVLAVSCVDNPSNGGEFPVAEEGNAGDLEFPGDENPDEPGVTEPEGGDTEGDIEAFENDIKGTLADYKIKPGDVLDVNGGMHKGINRQVRVDDKGFVRLVHVGRVKVSGKTKWQAEDFLGDKYKPFFKNCQITIEILNLRYFIAGEVMAPGQKAIAGDITLTQAIQAAGGWKMWADKTKVTIRRLGKDGLRVVKTYNCKKIEEGEAEDPYIKPDDQINVPR